MKSVGGDGSTSHRLGNMKSERIARGMVRERPTWRGRRASESGGQGECVRDGERNHEGESERNRDQ